MQEDYRARRGRDGHYYNLYPPGTTLLCLPIICVGNWLYDDLPNGLERAEPISSLAAKLVSAASVALFFLVLTELTQRRSLALILASAFALTTPQLGTHGGGLWSHNTSVFCALVAVFLWIWRAGRFAPWAAIPLALGFICRPTIIIPGVIFGIALFIQNRRAFLLFAGLSILCAIPFVYHSLGVWGSWLPPYFAGHASETGNGVGAVAFLGTLVSPSRGLFIYCPLLLFAVAGGVIACRRPGPGKIYLLAALICLGEWFFASRNPLWWGGHSYGPRLLCELLPFAMLLLLPAWEVIEVHSSRRFFFILAFLASGWGMFVQVQALANPAVHQWNAVPNVDFHPERLWDWRDWQILAGH